MTFLRIILSLCLVALGAFWTAREHFQKPFFEVQVEFEPQTPKTLQGWERRTVLKEAWASYANEQAWEVDRTRGGFEFMLGDEAVQELDVWVKDWNSAEMARKGLLQEELRLKEEDRIRQVLRLEERLRALTTLNQDLQGLTKMSPQWYKGSKDLGLSKLFAEPEEKTSEDKDQPQKEESPLVSPEDESNNVIAAEEGDGLEAQFRLRLTEEMNRAQSFLSQGQKDLEQRLLDGQAKRVNQVVRRMAGQEQRLLVLLEQQLKSLESQDRHWEESRKMVSLQIKDQAANLELELESLKDRVKPVSSFATLNYSLKGVEAPPEALRESFRYFLLGMVVCFIFNLLWEMVVQRDRL